MALQQSCHFAVMEVIKRISTRIHNIALSPLPFLSLSLYFKSSMFSHCTYKYVSFDAFCSRKTTHSTIIYQYHLSHILSIVFFNFSILKKTLFIMRGKGNQNIFSWIFTKLSRKKRKVPKRFDLVPQALLTCQSLGNRSSGEGKKWWTKKMENMNK